MIHLSTKSSVVTLINVFTVDPTHQQRLVELLTRATEVEVSHAPGFVSASLHRASRRDKGHDVCTVAKRRRLSSHAPRPRPASISPGGARHSHVRARHV